jgi:hypothetical protein
MAKDLPFFKFIPSEYNDGEISLCSLAEQGLFTAICSLYWSRETVLERVFASRKIPKFDEAVFKGLLDCGVLALRADGDQVFIKIKFLDEQFAELQNETNTGRMLAQKRWGKSANADGNASGNAGRNATHNAQENTRIADGNAHRNAPRNAKREDKIRKDTVDKHDSVLSTSAVSNGQKLRTGFRPVYAMPLSEEQEKKLDELSSKFYKEIYAKGDELGDRMILEIDMPDNVMLEFYERYEKYKSGVDEVDFEKVLQVAKSMKA